MKNFIAISCASGVATFIFGLFLFLIGLVSNGDVFFLGGHFYANNVVVVGTFIAMVGGGATAYSIALLCKPQDSN